MALVPAPPSLEAALDARVDARIQALLLAVKRPEFVHQRIVQEVTGMPGTDYLDYARAGDFPTWKVRRLVYAKSADVIAFIEAHPARPNRSNDMSTAEADGLARVGARRVMRTA
jgi:hypothetical protein